MSDTTRWSESLRLPDGRTRPWSATAAGRRIIGVDGEGNDIDGRHAYTLLCVADDRGELSRDLAHDGSRRERQGEGEDAQQANYGLPTRRILDFLLSLPERPTDLLVSFSFVYDATKIISDLPLRHLRELARTGVVKWEGYEIEFWPRKRFTVSQPRFGKRKVREADGSTRWAWKRSTTVWDAFGYFQKSFVAALADAGQGLFSAHERDVLIPEIRDMKGHRGAFGDMPADRVKAYCFAEVTMLAKMMRELVVGTEDQGLFPTWYHGSSAIAGRWMRDHHIPQAIADPGIPSEVVLGAYFGGRFESSSIGRHGDVHGSDLISAYPAELVHLPCLAHATCRRVDHYVPGAIGVYLTGSHTSGKWAPFPIRIDKDTARRYSIPELVASPSMTERVRKLAQRRVLYAHGGRRWLWHPEIEAARRHVGDDAIPVYDGWIIETGCEAAGCDNPYPFAALRDLFDERKLMKAIGDGREKVIKLLLNSAYGKTAQTIGWELAPSVTRDMVEQAQRLTDERGELFDPVALGLVKAPEMLCLIWAGLITSGCRAKIIDALYRSDDAFSVATDGVLSCSPIPGLTYSADKALGEWEHESYQNLTLYQNGIATHDGGMKRRGFSEADVPASKLIDAWDRGEWQVYPEPGSRAFVPLRQAMQRTDPLDLMGQWIENSARVSFLPYNRYFPPEYWLGDRPECMPTLPYELAHDVMSLGYVPKHTWQDRLDIEEFVGADYIDADYPEIGE